MGLESLLWLNWRGAIYGATYKEEEEQEEEED